MSKPRYKWWSYAKAMIRDYPALCAELEELHAPGVSSRPLASARSAGFARSTETIAIRELPKSKQREYEAVRRAVLQTGQLRSADTRLGLIDLVFWRRSHNIAGAAQKLYISPSTAKRYSAEFITLVGKNFGLLD